MKKRRYVSPLLEFPHIAATLRNCLAMPDFPEDAQRLAEHLLEQLRHSSQADPGNEISLSPRQIQILTLLSDGYSNKEIANRLELAEGTIKSYRKVLYQKLDVSRRSQAVARARSHLSLQI